MSAVAIGRPAPAPTRRGRTIAGSGAPPERVRRAPSQPEADRPAPPHDPLRLAYDALRRAGCEPSGEPYNTTAICPACRSAGLTLKVGADGRAALWCRSCETANIVAALGLKPSDLLPRARGLTSPSRRASDPPSRSAQSSGPSGVERRRVSPQALTHLSETVARCRALGIPAEPLRSFPCVLRGHDHEARVHRTATGWWGYSCDGGTGPLGFAEVYAAIRYGKVRRLGATEAQRWIERLDHDAGILDREPVPVPVDDDAPRSARRVASGIGLLVGLRAPIEEAPDGETRGWAPEDPFPFARTFAAAWCGISEKAVRTGLAYLEEAGVIERAGEVETPGPRRAATLWRLTAPSEGGGRKPPTEPPEDPPSLGDGGPPDEDALVAALIEALDAEEVIKEEPPEASRPSRAADGPPPCPYERHRAHDWIGDGGRRICGVCHPPANGARGGAS